MKILNIPFGVTLMTNTHKTRIRLLLAIGLLAAIVFGQQTAMAQPLYSEDRNSVLAGRNIAVANAIMSELGVLPPLKRYVNGVPYGISSIWGHFRETANWNFLGAGKYNQVTNLAQLSGIGIF